MHVYLDCVLPGSPPGLECLCIQVVAIRYIAIDINISAVVYHHNFWHKITLLYNTFWRIQFYYKLQNKSMVK